VPPVNKRQPLRVPNKYHRRGSGATVRDGYKDPLINGKNPLFCKITKRKQAHIITDRCREEPTAQIISAARQVSILGTPRADLRLARGLRAPSGRSSPCSRATRTLGRISASLEDYTRPPP
jgi:hypothetical protein